MAGFSNPAPLTVAALFVGVSQLLFIFNLIWSIKNGKDAGGNPWRATTLEWQTPETPPKHGNWGPTLPVVHRWAYDYAVPGAVDDFVPQNKASDSTTGEEHETGDSEGMHT